MPNEPDQGDTISRAQQCPRGGGEMTRCRIHVHERCPESNTRPAGREGRAHQAHQNNVRHASARIPGALIRQRRAQRTICARSCRCGEPRGMSTGCGEWRVRRAARSSRGIDWMRGVNTASRRFSNTSGRSAQIVERRPCPAGRESRATHAQIVRWGPLPSPRDPIGYRREAMGWRSRRTGACFRRKRPRKHSVNITVLV